ncbi:SCO6745 family protein [Microbispora sp. CA-135349]|uniref:SCO6745 family protein n=1 Tax=Microbispora sp. CA-135349 TaxID=3239953 RepID=UPI003D922D36
MNPRDAVVETKAAVGALGGGFMLSREVKALCERHGLGPREMYFRGRCGVLGEVDADVVLAAVVFFPAGHVRESWEGGRKLPAEEAAALYAGACHDWGRRKLAGLEDADRLAELLAAVADGADPFCAPLFAGWRAMPRPDGGPALAAHLLHVVRELRGARHATAVVACGVGALEATLVGAGGTGTPIPYDRASDVARFLAWPEPYPVPSAEAAERRAGAEELTDDLVARAYALLGPAELAELCGLLRKASQVARAR